MSGEPLKSEIVRILRQADEMLLPKVRCMDCGALVLDVGWAKDEHDAVCPSPHVLPCPCERCRSKEQS